MTRLANETAMSVVSLC